MCRWSQARYVCPLIAPRARRDDRAILEQIVKSRDRAGHRLAHLPLGLRPASARFRARDGGSATAAYLSRVLAPAAGPAASA